MKTSNQNFISKCLPTNKVGRTEEDEKQIEFSYDNAEGSYVYKISRSFKTEILSAIHDVKSMLEGNP